MVYSALMKIILSQIKEIVDAKLPLVSNLSNVTALLNQLENINWCGFYLADNETLYLGPFQGDVACTVIPFSQGVCGYAATNKKTIIVDDVNAFKGHIACSSLSKSEIVTPIIVDDRVKAVIDIDSPIYNRFSDKEKDLLEETAKILEVLFK